MKKLRTTEDVIIALGGIPAMAKLTNTSVNGVYNWRAGKQFPADTYLLIRAELAERGLAAPDSMWPMRQKPK